MKEIVFIVGESMIKKISGHLLPKFTNHQFFLKVTPFTTAKTIDMYDHLTPTLQDFNPDLFIIHVRSNNTLLNKTSNEIAEEIINLAESVNKSSSNIAISNILICEDDYKFKADEVNKMK